MFHLKLKKIILSVICCFFGLSAFISADTISLLDNLKTAEPGDYVVCSCNKSLTLFHIFAKNKSTLVIEEISAPISVKKKVSSWQDWITNVAPEHTSWVMYELDLATKNIEDMYSFSQRSWQKVYPQEQLFPVLISLKFDLIESAKRKKAGPRPPLDMPDERSIWNPPVYFEGKKIKGAQTDAYSAYWPADGSELSGKKIEVFLPSESGLPRYFPFWIQASNQFAQAKMRIIDSGQSLKSIHKNFPTPPLELISHQFTPRGDLQFDLKTHPSFEKYVVYLRESSDTAPIQKIPFLSISDPTYRKIRFTVSNQDLNNMCEPGKLYYFIFEPQNKRQMRIETIKPIGLAKPYVHP